MKINNENEIKKVLEERNLTWDYIEESIKQIEECCDYNEGQTYSSEIPIFIDSKKYLFKITVKAYNKFLDENGKELFGDDADDFVECITNYDVLNISISSENNDENCFVYNF